MRDTATASTERERTGAAPDGPTTDREEPTVRERAASALDGDRFVAAFRRRVEGTPVDPVVDRERFDGLERLPDAPFDAGPVRTELTVYGESYVYRWVVTAGAVERTRLPRDPETMAREQ